MDSEYSYSGKVDTQSLSPAFNDETLENNTSYKRFFTFLGMDLARWLSSWAFWGNLIAAEVLSVLLGLLTLQGASSETTNKFTTMLELSNAFIYTDLTIVILAGIIIGKDYTFKFATPLRSLVKYPLSFIGARLCVVSTITAIYSFIVYGSSWISSQILLHAFHRTFDPPISWWQYIFTSILFSIFFALCCAGITIIFRSTAVGIILGYIIIIILPQFANYIPQKLHLHLPAFMLTNAQSNSLQLNYPPDALKLTYWQNIGVGTLWAVIFIVFAFLAVAFWKNREIPSISHKKKQKNS